MPFLDKDEREKLWKPDTVEEYKELQRWIGSVKERSESEWMDVLRWYGRNDLFYLLNFLMTDGTILHSATNELFHFHEYYLDKCRATEYHALEGRGLDYSGRGSGKALSLDTNINTVSGWKKMKDIKVGDKVYDEKGNECNVVGVSPVWTDRDCYEITFTNNVKIVACGEHEWIVEDATCHRRRSSKITTEDIFKEGITKKRKTPRKKDGGSSEGKFSIPSNLPLYYSTKTLPIDPYVFGYWLGDGTSASATITSHVDDFEIFEYFKTAGYEISIKKYKENCNTTKIGSKGEIISLLRELNVLNNKHIPEIYLRGSIEQRLELLRGLMDSDGTVTKHCGRVTFENTNKKIIDGFIELTASLGLRPLVSQKIAKIYGKECGTCYRVGFKSWSDDRSCFKLKRKLMKLVPSRKKLQPWPGIGFSSINTDRRIVDIKKIDSIPVKCIEVDSPSHLYLAGEYMIPTHNSTCRSKAFPIMMMLNYPNIAMIIFSVEKNLAKKHSNLIRQELTENKILQTIYPDVLWSDPKRQTLELGLPWSAEEGFTIRRTRVRRNATVEVHAVFGGGPIGSRPDMVVIDDIESSEYVNSQDNIMKLKQAYSEAVTLATPVEIPHQIIMMSNTQFSKAGLVSSKIAQYEADDPNLVMGFPMEDLSISGDGPLGGTAMYPATTRYLFEKYREMEVKEEYSLQFALSFKSNSSFDESLINFYPEDPKEIAKRCTTYICIDASRGVEDPTAIVVWGIDPNGHKWWLDGVRKKLDPSKQPFYAEVESILNKWNDLSQRVVEIRVDQLGNQAWADLIRMELNRRGAPTVPVMPCTSKGKKQGLFDKGKNERIYQFWSPMLHRSEVHFPVPLSSGGRGIPAEDENGKKFCLVDYFLIQEYGPFPRSKFDDVLDAGALIEEDKSNKERPLQRGSDRMKSNMRAYDSFSSGSRSSSWMSGG